MCGKVQKDGPDFPAGKYLISIVLIKNDENMLKVNTSVITGIVEMLILRLTLRTESF